MFQPKKRELALTSLRIAITVRLTAVTARRVVLPHRLDREKPTLYSAAVRQFGVSMMQSDFINVLTWIIQA